MLSIFFSMIKIRHFYSYTDYNNKSLVLYNSTIYIDVMFVPGVWATLKPLIYLFPNTCGSIFGCLSLYYKKEAYNYGLF